MSERIEHYGSGGIRIRHQRAWNLVEYYYFATRSEARSSMRPGDRLEWWNGEVWVI